MAGPQALTTDDIRVVIEDDDNSVRTMPDGSIVVDQPDGGVVVQLNPQRKSAVDADDPSKFYANIADRIGDSELSVLAEQLFEAVSADDSSRSDWLATRADQMSLLGLKADDPRSGDSSAAVDGQSIVTNPLLLEATIKGWANAQAELLPAEGPCKIANYATDAENHDELAEIYQRDMNYYFTSIAKEFGPQTSHMLLWGCYFGGSGFKKVFTHPLKKRPYSEQVSPEHLIVSDASKSFDECERITHQISMRQSVMKRYQMKGIYRKVDLAPPTATPNEVDEEIASTQGVAANRDRPEDQPYTLWEIQCELDLPEFAPVEFRNEGIPLPYLVTLDKDSHEILAVRRDWKPEDEDCNRKKMYVKYPYVPGPGFYGTGLAGILGNSTAAMTAAWRLALDTAMYASFPAFITDKLQGRQLTSDFRLSPGQGTAVETGGRPLSEVVMGLPYKDVTPGLMALIDKITEQSKSVGGSPDIPVGEGTANIPVGTMLAHIEQASKTMAAAHKGQHAAMDEEISLIADLFRENPESFWRGNKTAQGQWTVEKLMEALNTYALVPRSDPNVPSHIHRVMRATALAELAATDLGKQTLDPFTTVKRILNAMREDPEGLVKPPPPPQQGPTPEDKMADAKVMEAQNKAEKNKVDAAVAAQKPQLAQMETEGSIKEKTIDLARALVTHSGDRADAQNDHQLGLADHARQVQKDAVDAQKTTHDAMIDRAKIGLEHRKIGVDEQQLALGAIDSQHQQGMDQHKAGLEEKKVGLAAASTQGELGIKQQQADTATHTALHPPKPAGAKAKPKKKKK